MQMNVFDTKFIFLIFFVLQTSQENRNGVRYLCRPSVVKILRLSFSQLYRHPEVGTGPVDIRTARSKAVFLGRQPFNAVPAPSTAPVGFWYYTPYVMHIRILLLLLFFLFFFLWGGTMKPFLSDWAIENKVKWVLK